MTDLSNIVSFFIDSVATPLAYTILGAAIVMFATYIRKRRNPLARILPFKVLRLDLSHFRILRDKITIAYGLISPAALSSTTLRHPYFMVEEGDFAAIYRVVSLSNVLYNRNNIEVENHEDAQSELHKIYNLVICSGPVWNNLTQLYLGLCGSPVIWQLWNGDLRLIVRDRSGHTELIETLYTDAHRPRKCFGLLLSAAIQRPREQQILLFGGNSNLSTYGGVLLLWDIHQNKVVQKEIARYALWKEKRWLIIFSIENWPEGGRWYSQIPPIKTGDLKLTIERVFKEEDFFNPYEYHMEIGGDVHPS